MDTHDTETSSLTSEVSLTRIHGESDLLGEHTSRRTTTGFLIDSPLLQAYIPTIPGKRRVRTWSSKQGEYITRKRDGKKLWLCKHCYEKSPPQLKIFTAIPTTLAIRHLMKSHGFLEDGTRPERTRKRKRDSQEELPAMVQRQLDASKCTFDREHWFEHFLAWIVSDNVSLNKTISLRLRMLLLYRNPMLQNVLPTSRQTTRDYITTAHPKLKPVVIQSLAKATSRISLSFDAWKSDNDLDLLAITAHYIDEHYSVKNVLLALRNTHGSHLGEEIKHHLLAVIQEYRITTKLAFFVADNASNNDTALELLAKDLFEIEPCKQRLRCGCHIINLVAKAILYGCDIDCIEEVLANDNLTSLPGVSQFEAILRGQDELAKLKAWRKKGPIGKLHIVVRHARASPKRREYFKKKQTEATPDLERFYSLVLDRGIKWNSTCDMLERSFKLKDAIELYQAQYRNDNDEPIAEQDLLTNDDWLELRELLEILKPLKQVSLELQHDGKDCNRGSLWQSLSAIDYLMTKLEALKVKQRYLPDTHFKAAVNLGWKKLDEYYELSDKTPAYRAAIFIHPAKKLAWFEAKWTAMHPTWITKAKKAIYSLYSEYKRRYADEAIIASVSAEDLTDFERYNLLEDEHSLNDDMERYIREERAPKDTNPLAWWCSNHHRYPILRHMAFDLLAAPASSAADERTFSIASHSLNEERYNTLADLAEATQCCRSWCTEGLIWQHQ